MNTYLLFRYLHILFILIMVGCIFSQQFMVRKELSVKEIKKIAITDALYGISALAVAAMGIVLWFGVGKGSAFYTHNWIFHIKVSLFIIAALLSAYPTIFYLKTRKKVDENDIIAVPKKLILILRTELIIVLIIPLLAVLMASGTGYFG